jgi:hypothetical protein
LDDGFIRNGEKITRESLDVMFSRMPTEISSLFKLSAEEHLHCTNTERQNVARASELLSHTVAEALRKYIDTPDAHRLADFIELVNNWFDLMNSRQTTAPENCKKPYENLDFQNKILDEMYDTILNMRCLGVHENKNVILPFQHGIARSITSLKNIEENLMDFVVMTTATANPEVLGSNPG